MTNRIARRNRRGLRSRLRHNTRRRELLAARRAALIEENGVLIDLTLESPPASIAQVNSGTRPVSPIIAIDLTVEDATEPSTSQGPSSVHSSPLSLSYSPVSRSSSQSPETLARRRLLYSSSSPLPSSPSVDSRATTPEFYRELVGSPVGPPSPLFNRESPDSDEEWPPLSVQALYPGYFPEFDSDQFPRQPNVPEGEPVPEEYYSLEFNTTFMREE